MLRIRIRTFLVGSGIDQIILIRIRPKNVIKKLKRYGTGIFLRNFFLYNQNVLNKKQNTAIKIEQNILNFNKTNYGKKLKKEGKMLKKEGKIY